MNKRLRIGVSMRVTEEALYHERRDSISWDLLHYIYRILPDSAVVLIPNYSKKTHDFMKALELNAFILTGGENIGSHAERDETEKQIFHYAQENMFPLLGICRGLQLIYALKGGAIIENEPTAVPIHRSTNHGITIFNKQVEVNSFHVNLLNKDTKPSDINFIALCPTDQSVEAVEGKNLFGIMWHPERRNTKSEWEDDLIKNFLENGKISDYQSEWQ